MAALNFPSTPSNGQLYTANGRTYRYNYTAGAWLLYESLPRATYDAENITEEYGGNWLFNTYLTFWSVGGMTLGTSNGAWLDLQPRGSGGEFELRAKSVTQESGLVGTPAGALTWNPNGAGAYEVWHSGNDGSGSGLDADTVDGVGAAASTYTPTLSNTTNVAASTAFVCQYLRVGNTVTVSGKVNIDPTAAGATLLGISLPIASAFTSDEELCGTAALSGGASQESGAIYADATNDRASLSFYAVTTSNSAWYFTFTYRVI